MSTFETLSLCIALLAAVIAAVSLWRTNRTNKEQLALQRVMSDLAQKQLEQLQQEGSSQNSAKILFRLEPSGRNHKFIIENAGEVPAENVSFDLIPQGELESPLLQSDFDQKFPVPVLAPGSSVNALAYFTLGSATSFRVILKWREADGRKRQQETYVSL